MKSLETDSKDDRPLKYMRQLDGLRTFAVLAVVWTHYLPSNYWPFGVYWGGIGVKLFFVLSGFIITRILFKCRQYVILGNQTSLFTIRQFYICRFLRLFPLYYATLTLTALVNIPPVRETIGWHIPYLSNIYFAIRGDWHGSVSHFWSLAVEEQFYLLWPLVILFTPKKILAPTIFFVILSGAFFRLTVTAFGLNEIAIWTLMPSCLDTLGLGSLLAYLTYRQETFNVSKEKGKNNKSISSNWYSSLFFNRSIKRYGG
jgi:peptidoglycan/LPS O-acetylase OafA/YrhL